jgi:hypothetical protein
MAVITFRLAAKLRDAGRVEILEAGGEDDGADVQVEELVLHIVVDGTAFAGSRPSGARANPQRRPAPTLLMPPRQ